MSREIRMVPENWEHPKNEDGSDKALYEGYKADSREFLDKALNDGLQEAIDYMSCPDKNDYMPDWDEVEKTHLMMYETTSEGTPLSPAFKTPEELAQWLADNGASSFGRNTATYEQWLRVCKGGYAPSAVYTTENGLQSGVEALNNESMED